MVGKSGQEEPYLFDPTQKPKHPASTLQVREGWAGEEPRTPLCAPGTCPSSNDTPNAVHPSPYDLDTKTHLVLLIRPRPSKSASSIQTAPDLAKNERTPASSKRNAVLKRFSQQRLARERALERIDTALRELQKEGIDLRALRLKRYRKTHLLGCTCPACQQAEKANDPHQRGLLEDGIKVYVIPTQHDADNAD